MILKLGCMIHCVSHPFWNLSYPKQTIIFPVLFDSHFFIQPSHHIPIWKNCTSFILSLFFNHSSHLIPPNPTFEIILQFCSSFTFSIIYPTQSHFWNSFAFLDNFPFFNLSFHPNPTHKHKILFSVQNNWYVKKIWGWLVGDWDGKQWDWSHPCLFT